MASTSQLTKNTLGLHAVDNCVLVPYRKQGCVVPAAELVRSMHGIGLLLNIPNGSWLGCLYTYVAKHSSCLLTTVSRHG